MQKYMCSFISTRRVHKWRDIRITFISNGETRLPVKASGILRLWVSRNWMKWIFMKMIRQYDCACESEPIRKIGNMMKLWTWNRFQKAKKWCSKNRKEACRKTAEIKQWKYARKYTLHKNNKNPLLFRKKMLNCLWILAGKTAHKIF